MNPPGYFHYFDVCSVKHRRWAGMTSHIVDLRDIEPIPQCNYDDSYIHVTQQFRRNRNHIVRSLISEHY